MNPEPLIKDPSTLPATKRQLWALYCITKEDWREKGLTMQQASDLIKEKGNPEYQKKTKSNTNKEFEDLMEKATQAANEAGDKWIAKHTQPAWNVLDGNKVVGTMLDVCGIVCITLKDKRTKFAKWYIQQIDSGKINSTKNSICIPHKYTMRQEWSLGEACEGAALKVLTDAGIKGLGWWSNID